MAKPLWSGDALKKVMDANLQYYSGLGRLSLAYMNSLTELVRELGGEASTMPATVGTTATLPLTPTPALVLEGEAGAEVQGVFMVANHLSRRVSAPVTVSAFRDEAGRERQPTLRVSPGTVVLEPGDRVLVQVSATVSDDLEPGAACQGELDVPGLSDRGIPVVLRRLPASEPASPVATDPAR